MNQACVESFVEQFRHKVDQAVSIYLARYPNLNYLREDLRSTGMLCLVEIANFGSDIDDLDAYVYTSIRRALSVAVRKEDPIQRPQGYESLMQVPLTESLEAPETFEAIDLADSLANACRDELDRDIVRLRSQGFRDSAISRQLGYGARHISKRRKAIERRMDCDS